MRKLFYIGGLLLLGACSSTSNSKSPLIGTRWQFETGNESAPIIKSSNFVYSATTQIEFQPDRVIAFASCRFRSPVEKTLLVTAEAPVRYNSSKGTYEILQSSAQHQDYKEKLYATNKRGAKGPERSIACWADLGKGVYSYDLNDEENSLTITLIPNPLRLKKVATTPSL